MSQADAQIAAIARSRGAAIATRNLADFADCGLRVLSPWDH
jgi:predicted nucleic acid-binding protein